MSGNNEELPLRDKKNHRVGKIKKQKNITEPYDNIKQPNIGVNYGLQNDEKKKYLKS